MYWLILIIPITAILFVLFVYKGDQKAQKELFSKCADDKIKTVEDLIKIKNDENSWVTHKRVLEIVVDEIANLKKR